MNIVKSVPLSDCGSESHVVKSCALALFKGLRLVGEYVAEIPAAATRAGKDVADAWEESSRPKA